jgi:hypothetical protein
MERRLSMAQWLIVRDGKGREAVTVFYDNLVTGMRYKLGNLSSDVPDPMIFDWIFKFGGPAYGDRIRGSDGSVFYFKRPEGARA